LSLLARNKYTQTVGYLSFLLPCGYQHFRQSQKAVHCIFIIPILQNPCQGKTGKWSYFYGTKSDRAKTFHAFEKTQNTREITTSTEFDTDF
jgi:hypothetical protein